MKNCYCILILIFFPLFSHSIFAQNLEVIQFADSLLIDSSKWHQEDDRFCQDDKERNQWSLYCVLYEASIQINGKYKHRGKVMRSIRKAIKQATPKQRFKHPIRDYNNLQTTKFKDIKEMLRQAIELFSAQNK